MDKILKHQEMTTKNHEASMKSLERQIGQISKQISVEKSSSSLPSDTIPNPKEECKAIQLRSGKVLVKNEEATKKPKESDKKQAENIKEPTEDEKQAKDDEAKEQVVMPNKSTEKLKEKDNHLHSSKKVAQGQQQIRKSITPPLPYPQRFNKEVKDQHFHKFLEIFKKLEINIPLAEALEQMPLYAKFLKELINKKRSWDEKEPYCSLRNAGL